MTTYQGEETGDQRLDGILKQLSGEERDYVLSYIERDGLTGVYNRRKFEADLPSYLAQSQRKGLPLSILLFDIDHFKTINDQYGHTIGDTVLKAFASCVQTHIRPGDRLYRYGGEEFAVFFPDTEEDNAYRAAERLPTSVADSCVIAGPPERVVTASGGIVTYPTHCETPGDLVRHADQALYQSKGTGRNKITIAKRMGEEK